MEVRYIMKIFRQNFCIGAQRLRAPVDSLFSGGGAHNILSFIAAIFSLVVLVLLISHVLLRPENHDEQLFLTTGILWSQFHVYRDLQFGHLPNHPFFIHVILQATSSEKIMLTGRLTQIGMWIALVGIVIVFAKRFSGSILVGLTAAILLMVSPVITKPGSYTSNNLLPIIFLLLGAYALLVAIQEEYRSRVALFAAGALFALAMGSKANYIFGVIAPTIIIIFAALRRPLGHHVLNILFPFAVGGIMGGLPSLYFFITDPEIFWRSVTGGANPDTLQGSLEVATDRGADFAGQLLYGRHLWFEGVELLIFVSLVIASSAFIYRFRIETKNRDIKFLVHGILFLVLMLIGSFIVPFLIKPSHVQYFQPPIVISVVCAIFIFGRFRADTRRAAAPVVFAVAVVAFAAVPTHFLAGFPLRTIDSSQWTGSVFHQASHRFAEELQNAGLSGKITVATLAPIVPLEAGLSIYPELAAGPFKYRTADFLPEAERVRLNRVSVSTMPAFLSQKRPDAILVGVANDPALEIPFIEFAEQAGYIRRDLGPRPGGVLYIRPYF